MVAQRLRDYEIVIILSPEATDEEVEATMERMTNFITEHGGSVSEQDNWGVRRLAYSIRRFLEGNYILVRFTLDAKDILELDRSLVASEIVLRHLATKV